MTDDVSRAGHFVFASFASAFLLKVRPSTRYHSCSDLTNRMYCSYFDRTAFLSRAESTTSSDSSGSSSKSSLPAKSQSMTATHPNSTPASSRHSSQNTSQAAAQAGDYSHVHHRKDTSPTRIHMASMPPVAGQALVEAGVVLDKACSTCPSEEEEARRHGARHNDHQARLNLSTAIQTRHLWNRLRRRFTRRTRRMRLGQAR